MRNLLKLLEYEAKKRPMIAELVNRIETMSDDDITKANVPLPWFRKALTMLREQKRLNMDIQIKISYTPDISGEVREWFGGDIFLKRHKGSMIFIHDGDLLWFPITGGWWQESVFSLTVENHVLNYSKPLGDFKRSEYFDLIQKRLREKYGDFVETIGESRITTPAQSLIEQYGVRFF